MMKSAVQILLIVAVLNYANADDCVKPFLDWTIEPKSGLKKSCESGQGNPEDLCDDANKLSTSCDYGTMCKALSGYTCDTLESAKAIDSFTPCCQKCTGATTQSPPTTTHTTAATTKAATTKAATTKTTTTQNQP